jgi:hypothetical protein
MLEEASLRSPGKLPIVWVDEGKRGKRKGEGKEEEGEVW